MSDSKKNIKNYLQNNSNSDWESGPLDVSSEHSDERLFDRMSEFFKGEADIIEIENDPALSEIESVTSEMITRFRNKVPDKNLREFVGKNLAIDYDISQVNRELQEVLHEISDKGINSITSDWVKEWHNKHQVTDPGTANSKAEIRDFIKKALEPVANEKSVEEIVTQNKNKHLKGRIIARYSIIAAAAVIGVFITIRTLSWQNDPDKIFSDFYSPYPVLSGITRNENDHSLMLQEEMAEYYRQGKYENVIKLFGSSATSDLKADYYAGLSYLHIKDTGKAISLLTLVADSEDVLSKDASWYLGLAYIMSNDKTSAVKYLKPLAESGGYYQERSEKLLRRLR